MDQDFTRPGDGCPHCGGTIVRDGDELLCLMCARVVNAPPPPTLRDLTESRRKSRGSDHTGAQGRVGAREGLEA